MHKYLRAIGFSQYKSKKDVKHLLDSVIASPATVDVVQIGSETFTCLTKEYGTDFGLTLCGEYDENEVFHTEYYFPHLLGSRITTQCPCTIERHAEKSSFSGLCEDPRVGLSLIFYLQNAADFLRFMQSGSNFGVNPGVIMGALSVSGKILLPVLKDEKQAAILKTANQNRYDLLNAAKNGDSNAIEQLTLDDMELYTRISRRMTKEDVYSIVDSSFMPNGVECDHYTIIGEIKAIRLEKNSMTGEDVYSFLIDCNDMLFQLGINRKDLLGEPLVGRRFKGEIWLQGLVDFDMEEVSGS